MPAKPNNPTARSSPADGDSIEQALAALRAEELIVYPTETLYGLGADPFSATAMRRLMALKGREADKPIGLIAAELEMVTEVVAHIPPPARRLAEAFWPGPLTMVLPPLPSVPAQLRGFEDGVAVRVSPHPVARALAAGLGRPITATSANLAGQPAAITVAEARACFGGAVKVYLEGGTLAAGAPSTVVAFPREHGAASWRVLRAGAISERQIAAVLSSQALE